MNQGVQWTATIGVKGTPRQMNPQITKVVKGADDIDGDGLADLVSQQGTANWYRRSIPTAQTLLNTTTFDFTAALPFSQADGTTVLPLPANTTHRNELRVRAQADR